MNDALEFKQRLIVDIVQMKCPLLQFNAKNCFSAWRCRGRGIHGLPSKQKGQFCRLRGFLKWAEAIPMAIIQKSLFP